MMTHAQPAPLRAGAAQVEITPPLGTQISGDIGRRRRDPEYDCEIQPFRLGDIAIVGLPGEPFVDRQLHIKVESPAYPTYVAHNCNDLLGRLRAHAARIPGRRIRDAHGELVLPGARGAGHDGRPHGNHAQGFVLRRGRHPELDEGSLLA